MGIHTDGLVLKVTAAVNIIHFYSIPQHRAVHEQKNEKLSIAPNLDPSTVDPGLLPIQTVSDLRVRHDACIGKLVQIVRGPFKSYRGIVKCRGREDHFVVQMDAPRGMEMSFAQADLVLVLCVEPSLIHAAAHSH